MKEIVVTTLEEIKSKLQEIIIEAVMDGLSQYQMKEKEKFQSIEVAAEISLMSKHTLYGMKCRGELEGKDICFNSGKRKGGGSSDCGLLNRNRKGFMNW